MVQAVSYLLGGLLEPFYFGFLWPAVLLAAIVAGRRLWRSPTLFPALFIIGNLACRASGLRRGPHLRRRIPRYVRATLDRLLLHLTPTATLLLALGLKDLRGEPGDQRSPALPSTSPPQPP